MILPAIDLRGGRCVRLRQGDFAQEKVFAEDPVEVARAWERQGAQRLHVVDLDGAKTGTPDNLAVVKAIAGAVNIPIQLGGGMRSAERVQQAFAAGVDRIIVGTKAITDQAWVKDMVDAYGERVLVGLDARSGKIAVEGWLKTSDQTVLSTAQVLHQVCGVQEFIYTDISKDGLLTGPDIAGLQSLLGHGFRVIASGGISNVLNLQQLKPLKALGLSGAVVGTALYTGAIDLRQALSVWGG